jgi:hypothetical protein
MEREDFDETAPGEIVPTTTPKGTYSAFRPDPLPPSIDTDQLITPLAEATQALGRLHGIDPRVGSREIPQDSMHMLRTSASTTAPKIRSRPGRFPTG